jgi:hypothetical protein
MAEKIEKYCGKCKYVAEAIVFDGKDTHIFRCRRIRGGGTNEYGQFYADEMKVSKYKKACQFFKQD